MWSCYGLQDVFPATVIDMTTYCAQCGWVCDFDMCLCCSESSGYCADIPNDHKLLFSVTDCRLVQTLSSCLNYLYINVPLYFLPITMLSLWFSSNHNENQSCCKFWEMKWICVYSCRGRVRWNSASWRRSNADTQWQRFSAGKPYWPKPCFCHTAGHCRLHHVASTTTYSGHSTVTWSQWEIAGVLNTEKCGRLREICQRSC